MWHKHNATGNLQAAHAWTGISQICGAYGIILRGTTRISNFEEAGKLPASTTEEVNMASISSAHLERCPRCSSKQVNLEWEEPLNEREVQDLWRCWNCNNTFITSARANEKEPSVAEITRPFFTSLVME